MLAKIAQNGTDTQRAVARNTLIEDRIQRSARVIVSERFRGLRASLRQRRQALGPRQMALAGATAGALDRSVYIADGERLPGRLSRTEGSQASGDAAVDEAYDGFGRTYELYSTEYNRNSLDDRGLPLHGSVHYGVDYDNAFWNGTQMVFGDGDRQLFNRFTISVDVIAHELTHGVTEHESNLVYAGQPGALNEHLSDAFGSLVKQYPNQRADQADWLIGEGLFTAAVQGKALRSMKAPGTAYDDPVIGKDPQPGHIADYVRGPDDNYGVHINSGIPNRAFYLAATKIGGCAWDSAGLIWYEAMVSPYLRPYTRFIGFARLTVWSAGAIFGRGSTQQDAVREAWSEVGLDV